MASLRSAAVATVLALMACGDPLADETYRGQPLYTIQGQIHGSSYDVDLADPVVRVSLFWNPAGTGTASISDLVEQVSTSTQVTVPASWTMYVFEPPSQAMMHTTPSGAEYATGRILVYVDTNENGRWDPDEPVVASDVAVGASDGGEGDKGHVVFYAPAALAVEDSPTGLPMLAGFHRGRRPIICQGRPAGPPATDGGCGVTLGAECETSADCDEYTCLGVNGMQDFIGLVWPQGACAVPLATRCVPPDSSIVSQLDTSYYLRSCGHDSDCGRPWPYVCDETEHACMPDGLEDITLSDYPLPEIMDACLPADAGMPLSLDGGLPLGPDGGMPPPRPDGGRPPPPPP